MSDKPLTMHPFESAIVRTLEADNARLTAEVERLKKEIIGRQAHDRMQVREIKHLTAEVERRDAALRFWAGAYRTKKNGWLAIAHERAERLLKAAELSGDKHE
jgi:hypothetical protein